MKKILLLVLLFLCGTFFLEKCWSASSVSKVSAVKVNGLKLTNVRDLEFGELVAHQTVVLTATSPNAGEVLVETSSFAPITAWFSGSDGGAPTSQLELSDGATHHMMVTNIGLVANGQTVIGNTLNLFCDSVGKCSIIIIGELSAGDDTINPPGEYEEEGYTNVILG